ncbi:MAG: FG-GAP-like repeat-containing protein [Planctomycetota bacterium]
MTGNSVHHRVLALALFALAAHGCGSGGGSSSDDGTVETHNSQTPIVALQPEVMDGGVIVLPFLLCAPDEMISVSVESSHDGGKNFTACSSSSAEVNPGDYESLETGAVNVFHWNALRDLGAGTHATVVTRYTIRNGSKAGSDAATPVFAVDLNASSDTMNGTVVDEDGEVVEGAEVSFVGTDAKVGTDARGAFKFTGVGQGPHLLTLKSGTAAIIATAQAFVMGGGGDQNGRPFFVTREDQRAPLSVDPQHAVDLSCPGSADFQLTAAAGATKFADGSGSGTLTATALPVHRLPAPPPNGEFPISAVAVAPAGVSFTPGASVRLANDAELPAWHLVNLWVVDPATGEYKNLGQGTVDEDGKYYQCNPDSLLKSSGIVVGTITGFPTTLNGRVIDESSDGVAGAWVFASGAIGKTRADGRFEVSGIPIGYDIVEGGEPTTTYVTKLDTIAVQAWGGQPATLKRRRSINPVVGAWTGTIRQGSVTDAGDYYLDRSGPKAFIDRIAPAGVDGKVTSTDVEVWGRVLDLDQTENLAVRVILAGNGWSVQAERHEAPAAAFVEVLSIPQEAFSRTVVRAGEDIAFDAVIEVTDQSGLLIRTTKSSSFPVKIALEQYLPTAAPRNSEVPLDLVATDDRWGLKHIVVKEYRGTPGNLRREFVQKLTFSSPAKGEFPTELRTTLSGGTPALQVPDSGLITLDVVVTNGLGIQLGKTFLIAALPERLIPEKTVTGHIANFQGSVLLSMPAVYKGGVSAQGDLKLSVWPPTDHTTLPITIAPPDNSGYLPTTVIADFSAGAEAALGAIELEAGRIITGRVVNTRNEPQGSVRIWLQAIGGGQVGSDTTSDVSGKFKVSGKVPEVLLNVRPPVGSGVVATTVLVRGRGAGTTIDIGDIMLMPALNPPILFGISPNPFGEGEPIAIRGRGFSSEPGSNTLYFNKIATSPESAAETSLLVTVPNGARSGHLRLDVNGMRSNPVAYNMRPYLDHISPDPEAAPKPVTLEGSGFATDPAQSQVTFGGGVASNGQSGDTHAVTLPLPNAAITGAVRVSANGQKSNSQYFRVKPGITSISPQHPSPLQVMLIRGTGFHTAEGAMRVKLSGQSLDADSPSPNTLETRVPLTAKSGPLVVRSHNLASDPFDVVLSTTTAIGRVLDHLGRPVAGASVEVYGTAPEGDPTYFRLPTATGADGRFSLEGVPTLEDLYVYVRDVSKGYPREKTAGPKPPVAFGLTDFGDLIFESHMWPILPCPTSPMGREPIAVVVADLNGDGLDDIASANSWSNDVTVRVAQHNGAPNPMVTYAVGQTPSDLIAVDLDKDGDQDLVVTNRNSNTVSILLNNGTATFASATHIAVHREPLSVASADLNGDTIADLVVANEIEDGLSVLIGKGDGTFQPPTFLPSGNAPHDLALGDLNRDHKADLVAVNFSADNVAVFLGNGDGTFGAPTLHRVGQGPSAVMLADVDQDGHLDVLTANTNDSTASVLLGRGTGDFYPAVNYTTGRNPNALCVCEVTRDGLLDITTANIGDDTLTTLPGHGDGTFGGPISFEVSAEAVAIAMGNIDSDGLEDLVVANRFGDDLRILLAESPDEFRAPVRLGATPAGGGTIADLNNDGHQDVALLDTGGGNVLIHYGLGNGRFGSAVSYPTTILRPDQVTAADVDRDGDLDLIITSSMMSKCVVLKWQPSGYTATPSFDTNDGPMDHVVADFNGDQRVDLAFANTSANTITLFQGRGDGTFSGPTTLATGRNPRALEALDMDASGTVDLVVALNGVENLVSIYRGKGDGTFLPKLDFTIPFSADSLATGDLNRDGLPDLVLGHSLRDQISILLNRGGGAMSAPVVLDCGIEPTDVFVGDLNIDEFNDIAVTNHSRKDLTIFPGNGDGTFQPLQIYASGQQSLKLLGKDLNDDGAIDLISLDPASGAMIHLNQTLR